jgi:hypothetical protein
LNYPKNTPPIPVKKLSLFYYSVAQDNISVVHASNAIDAAYISVVVGMH